MSNVRVGLGVTLLLGLTLSALLMLMATAPAQAQTCQTEIDELVTATEGATFTGNIRRQGRVLGLLGKRTVRARSLSRARPKTPSGTSKASALR